VPINSTKFVQLLNELIDFILKLKLKGKIIVSKKKLILIAFDLKLLRYQIYYKINLFFFKDFLS
jgi:ABC-type phosphate transport system ATPase subunit